MQFRCSLNNVEVVVAQNDQRHYTALLVVRNEGANSHWAADVDLLLRGEPASNRISAYEALLYALEMRVVDGISKMGKHFETG